MGYHEFTIEGRNAVMEAFRSGKCIDKLFVLDGCQDGPVLSIKREAKKQDTVIRYVNKERLDQMSETGKHQGVIAYAAAYDYAEVEDIMQSAKDKGEDPFIFLLDNIEDPHNLGAMIRTAHLAGAHGVIEVIAPLEEAGDMEFIELNAQNTVAESGVGNKAVTHLVPLGATVIGPSLINRFLQKSKCNKSGN